MPRLCLEITSDVMMMCPHRRHDKTASVACQVSVQMVDRNEIVCKHDRPASLSSRAVGDMAVATGCFVKASKGGSVGYASSNLP